MLKVLFIFLSYSAPPLTYPDLKINSFQQNQVVYTL